MEQDGRKIQLCEISKYLFIQRENAHLNFRWTTRTTRSAVLSLVVIPLGVYYVFARDDVCQLFTILIFTYDEIDEV